jgi:hypothetical protein
MGTRVQLRADLLYHAARGCMFTTLRQQLLRWLPVRSGGAPAGSYDSDRRKGTRAEE